MATPITHKRTSALAVGDIVQRYDMRVELVSENKLVTADRTLRSFQGRVLNPEEVDPRFIPVSWRTEPRFPEFAPGTYWAIQGNDFVTWRVEA